MRKPPPSLLSLFDKLPVDVSTRAPSITSRHEQTEREQKDARNDGSTPLRVSELLRAVRGTLDTSYPDVRIVGEISGFKVWAQSGHWYFDLKDDSAVLPCVMLQSHNRRLGFVPVDGIEVVARGRVSMHPKQSRVQLHVERLDPIGAGALALAFDAMKKRLQAEGLFDARRKKRLPLLPRCVGIVTSLHGAVLHDVVKIVRARLPQVSILVSPTRVQGEGASEEIADALRRLDEARCCDVILLCRGGGSPEDLAAFNGESLAYAIAACATPVVSGVGHEPDVTIADFVADVRAATPSHAAETAVPEERVLRQRIDNLAHRLQQRLRQRVDVAHLRVTRARGRLDARRPALARIRQRADIVHERLEAAWQARRQDATARLEHLEARLFAQRPDRVVRRTRARLEEWRERLLQAQPTSILRTAHGDLAALSLRMTQAASRHREQQAARLAVLAGRLAALSPLSVLDRGYALAERPTGTLVVHARDVRAGDELLLSFADGQVVVRVVRAGSEARR